MTKEKIKQHLSYLAYVARHKVFVTWAAVTKVTGIPLMQLLKHDLSKFSCTEYPIYRRKFRPVEGEAKVSEDDWEAALIHHYNSNQHHPEYWRINCAMKEMPEVYVREMVADWLGAGKAITGTWDMTKFLNDRFKFFNFHTRTLRLVIKTLAKAGYLCKEGVWEYRG